MTAPEGATVWSALPPEAQAAVAARVGRIDGAWDIEHGSLRQLAAVLHTDGGPVFCKGVRTAAASAWLHRNELTVNPWLPAHLVPRVRWSVEAAGWLLTGFDHVDGATPDISPGSPELGLVASALVELTAALTPAPVTVRSFTRRWAGLVEPAVVAGNTLLHTDMTPRNFLVAGERVWVVDWATPSRGAAWIDAALMVVRLIRAGHEPASAVSWAQAVPAWGAAPPASLTAFAWALAGLAHRRSETDPAPHRRELADAARRWACHMVEPGSPGLPGSSGEEGGLAQVGRR